MDFRFKRRGNRVYKILYSFVGVDQRTGDHLLNQLSNTSKQLDKLIQKIRISERKENDNIIQLIQQLEKEGRIDQEIADTVVQEYGKSLNCLIVD